MSAVFVATGASSDAKPVGQDWVLSVPSVRWNRSRVAEHRRCRPTRRCGPAGEPARSTGSGGGTRTLDLTIMSRALSPTELPRRCRLWSRHNTGRAPKRNRTVDLLLTMETLYRLSYWGKQDEGTRRAAPGEIRRPIGQQWQVKDSNLRRLSRRIYSPLPLAARATCRMLQGQP